MWKQDNNITTMNNLRKQWNDACMKAGLTSLSTDTSAKIMAVLLVHGGDHESITHNTKLMADCEYIQERYNIKGGLTPDKEFSYKLKIYVKELESHEETNGSNTKPQWAISLFNEFYNIKL